MFYRVIKKSFSLAAFWNIDRLISHHWRVIKTYRKLVIIFQSLPSHAPLLSLKSSFGDFLEASSLGRQNFSSSSATNLRLKLTVIKWGRKKMLPKLTVLLSGRGTNVEKGKFNVIKKVFAISSCFFLCSGQTLREINFFTLLYFFLPTWAVCLHRSDYIKPWRLYKTFQWDPVLGGDWSGVDIESQQASVAAEKVHQTGCIVSGFNSISLHPRSYNHSIHLNLAARNTRTWMHSSPSWWVCQIQPCRGWTKLGISFHRNSANFSPSLKRS